MLNKSNFEIAKLCPQDDNRSAFALHGIHVTPKETTVTDGHMLLKISTGDAADHFDPFILPAVVALKIAAALPTGSEIPFHDHANIEHTEGEAAVRISVTNEDTDQDVYSARSIARKFPSIDKVIPNVEEAALEMVFDLDILVPLLKQISEFHGTQAPDASWKRRYATFRFYKDVLGAQRIDAKNDLGQELTAVIMPCRVAG